MKVPVINVAYPGGEVSRHTDKGDNTNHWIGRCATLQGKGVFHRYDIAGDLLDSEIVEAGDVLTHFNPANATRRLEHDAVTIGDKARISLGLLLPLKRELPWSKRSQAAHATVEG